MIAIFILLTIFLVGKIENKVLIALHNRYYSVRIIINVC